ncbi:MAG: discoidin domain-containing protein, partial [Muribaculaceae bacterium]
NTNMVVFAATVANDDNNNATPACDLMKVHLPAVKIDHTIAARTNLLAGKPCIEKSGEVNSRECAPLAVDGREDTKWCDNGTDQRTKYIAFDLGKITTIKGWDVLHATLENTNYTTKQFSLQVKTNEGDQWNTVDTVTDNTEMETDRLLPQPVEARFVRLYITKPDQSEGFAARIYEFQVY